MTEHMHNADEICRRCHGNGYKLCYEPDGYTGVMKHKSHPCYHCNGTGTQTVMVTPVDLSWLPHKPYNETPLPGYDLTYQEVWGSKKGRRGNE